MICSGWLRHRPRDSDRCSGDEAETLFDRVPIGSLFARENSQIGLFAFEDLTLEGDLSDIEAVTKQIGERSPRKWNAADPLACFQRANPGDDALLAQIRHQQVEVPSRR